MQRQYNQQGEPYTLIPDFLLVDFKEERLPTQGQNLSRHLSPQGAHAIFVAVTDSTLVLF